MSRVSHFKVSKTIAKKTIMALFRIVSKGLTWIFGQWVGAWCLSVITGFFSLALTVCVLRALFIEDLT